MLETISHFLNFHSCDLTEFEEYEPEPEFALNAPSLLEEIWKTHGLTTYGKGFIASIDPKEWAPILERLLPSSIFSMACFRTGMGGVIVFLDPAREKPSAFNEDYLLICPITKKITELTSDLTSLLNGWLTTDDMLNTLFYWNEYKILTADGILPNPECCFGFKLAPSHGGDFSISNFHLVNTQIYWDLLRQA